MRSLLYSDDSPFPFLGRCQAPQRSETEVTFLHKGLTYRVKVRSALFVEDPYINMVKAYAYEIKNSKPVSAPPNKKVKDYLIKDVE